MSGRIVAIMVANPAALERFEITCHPPPKHTHTHTTAGTVSQHPATQP
jgi:hypothetical protein